MSVRLSVCLRDCNKKGGVGTDVCLCDEMCVDHGVFVGIGLTRVRLGWRSWRKKRGEVRMKGD